LTDFISEEREGNEDSLQPLLDDHVRSFATQLSVDKLFLEKYGAICERG
jgi:hypothetical protein